MRSLSWVPLLALCACTAMHGGEDRYWLKPDASSSIGDVPSLLQYASYARNLGAAEREREIERQRSAYGRDKSDFRRLQYALLLSAPEAAANERKLAHQLVEPLLESKRNPDLAALAGLVYAQLNAQASATATSSTAIAQCQKRAEELEKKLDAVKDIERSLMRREKGKL
jgi:hypothetical protein